MIVNDIDTIPAREADRELCEQIVRAAYYEMVIREMGGWDETQHRVYMEEGWRRQPPEVIRYRGEPIGTVRVYHDEHGIEISQFCILPAYQGRGIGTQMLRRILAKADASGKDTRLSVLHSNPAKRLYERHGFRIIGQDETFYYMERKPAKDPTGQKTRNNEV